MESFKELGLSQATINAIEEKGYTKPTEIQAKTIPILLTGEKDIVGQSQTGTGKTACFALPIIERLKGNQGVKALILTPTRELALQITKEFESFTKKLKILTVYGGAPIVSQIKQLGSGVDIVVGTPGRVIDLIKRKSLVITNIEYCVLDEADEMLNMGFVDDIELILKGTPKDKKMLLFSATMPPEIKKIAERFMREYTTIYVKKQELTTDLIEQIYYEIHGADRFEALRRVIDITEEFHGIIFCKTKLDVDHLSAKLLNANYPAGALHGDITQAEREKILGQFKKKKLTVLIATDVAARGIDVNDLTHVINYSLPQSPELYVHRIGRTGRAGKKGIAITFVIPSERHKLKYVEKAAKCKIIKSELPKISDVLKTKQIHLEEKIKKISSSKHTGKFDKIAANLLESNNAIDVVNTLLEHIFGKEEKGYNELSKIAETKGNFRDRKGRNFSKGSKSFGNRRNDRSNDNRSHDKSSANNYRSKNNDRTNDNRGHGSKSGFKNSGSFKSKNKDKRR